jgi:hypothetical protein
MSTFADAHLWSLDRLMQPTSHTCASHGRCDPIGTVHYQTAGSSVACTTRDCIVVSLLGLLEHLLSLLNLHLAGRIIYGCRDGVLRFHGFLEILQRLRPSYNSLGKHSALLGQPLLFDERRTATMCARYSSLFPREYMGMLRWDASGSLILKIWGSSLGMTMSTTGTYGMGGR